MSRYRDTLQAKYPVACHQENLLVPLVCCAESGVVGRGGLEPPTSRLSGVRSNHLSYRPSIILQMQNKTGVRAALSGYVTEQLPITAAAAFSEEI